MTQIPDTPSAKAGSVFPAYSQTISSAQMVVDHNNVQLKFVYIFDYKPVTNQEIKLNGSSASIKHKIDI